MSEQSLSLAKVNELIQGALSGKFKEIQDNVPSGYYKERNQGEESETRITIYDPKDDSGIFVQVNRYIDSYGDVEEITGIKLVKKLKKEVEVYE